MIALFGLAALAQSDWVPAVDSQLFRAPLSAGRLSWTEDPERPSPGPFVTLAAHWTRDPLRFVAHDMPSAVVHDLLQGDLVGGYAAGPVRVGLALPIVAQLSGWTGAETGLSDLALCGAVTLHASTALTVGVDGRLWLPTATVAAPVGGHGLSGELLAAVARDVGPVRLALNAGLKLEPRSLVGDVSFDDAVTSRLGASYALTERVGLTTELAAQLVPSAPDATSSPVEALLGGYVRTRGPLGVKLAAGRGLTGAVGAPGMRAVAAIHWSSPPRPARDLDLDGLADDVDRCPREAEDRDGWRDEDGCAERPWLVVRVSDEAGRPLEDVKALLRGQGLEVAFTGSLDLEVDPGSYTVLVHDSGYGDALTSLAVADGPPTPLELVLRPRQVTMTQDRIELDGEIFFETGSDVILQESWRLLDEVAAVLTLTPQIVRLRIEGHTDTVGDSLANRLLSERRAAAVRSALLARGIDAGRVVSVGFGEDRPLVASPDEVAVAANRRVALVVEQWDPTNLGRLP